MEPQPTHTESLETCIRHRHSIRSYKPDAIDPDTLHACLALAQLAPSNSNIQNWRLHLATGAARDRITTNLHHAASEQTPPTPNPALPAQFRPYRSAMGHELYGPQGYDIPREDRVAQEEARMRNYRFFDAPVVGLLTMDKGLQLVDAMSVGMYVQTLMLALTERGLGACLMVSVTGYADLLRAEFGVGEDQIVLCGMAIGVPAPDAKVNRVVVGRDEVERQVRFLVD